MFVCDGLAPRPRRPLAPLDPAAHRPPAACFPACHGLLPTARLYHYLPVLPLSSAAGPDCETMTARTRTESRARARNVAPTVLPRRALARPLAAAPCLAQAPPPTFPAKSRCSSSTACLPACHGLLPAAHLLPALPRWCRFISKTASLSLTSLRSLAKTKMVQRRQRPASFNRQVHVSLASLTRRDVLSKTKITLAKIS